jgi:hypothetical protein
MRALLSSVFLIMSLSAPGLTHAASGTLTPPYNESRYVDASAPLHGILWDNGSMRATAVMAVFSTLAVFAIPLYIALFSERLTRQLMLNAQQPRTQIGRAAVVKNETIERPRRAA